jgi:very-short-patch-repair endonuclease
MRAPVLSFKRARSLRGRMTLPEVLLWKALRRRSVSGLRFRRQHPVGPYILDFFCPASRLAVEVDGAVHDTGAQALRDERRNAWLAARHIRVLRVTAADILKADRLEWVLLAIEQAAEPPPPPTAAPPPLRG